MKGSVDVVTIKPGTQVADAVRLLSENRIGALVVADLDKPEGILSERDIVREMGKRGTACVGEPVSNLMTAKLVTCSPSDTALDVLEMMTNGRFRHLPVMDGPNMIGLISIGDAVKARLAELAMEKDALEGMIMGH